MAATKKTGKKRARKNAAAPKKRPARKNTAKKRPARKNVAPKKRARSNGGGDRRRLPARMPRHRRNQADGMAAQLEDAAARYEYFHGRDPEIVSTVEQVIDTPSVVSGIGRLEKLIVKGVNGNKVVLGDFQGALLAQNIEGTQLYIQGGDQAVNLKDFGITVPHEQEILGACQWVYYFTTKDHLGDDGGEAIYKHKFGPSRETPKSKPPVLIYDVRNRLLFFAGGNYDLPEVGIRG